MANNAKKYVSDNVQLMAEWDWARNDALGFFPNRISCGSHKKVWWKCSKNHIWSAAVSNRARLGRGCPYCNGQKVVIGENDLLSKYPNLAAEWNYAKNEQMLPQDFMCGSHTKVWWICEKGHEWYAEIKSRTSGVGCPYCSNKMVLAGYNDLASIHPELAKEWHPTKNGELKCDQVTFGSGKAVWWLCKNGHEWRATVCNRTKGRGCPECASRRRTSFPEQAIFFYVKKAFPDAVNRYKEIFENSSMELDIYIPQIKMGIEFDGKEFHSKDSNRIRDMRKYLICREKGIKLIRITDNMRTEIIITCDHKITIPVANSLYLSSAITKLLYKLERPIDVNVERDRLEILQYLTSLDDSLSCAFPDLANEWNYEKNGFSPANIHPGSNEKVWWRCSICGHEWKTSLSERTGRDQTGCPICARKRGVEKRKKSALIKHGSVAERAPELLCEWDYDQNEGDPASISSSSNNKAWWKCRKCNYQWQGVISKRVIGHGGCPCCNNRVVVKGKNDLTTTHPQLMEEWDFEKNETKPTEIVSGSGKKIWWKCKTCGHAWLAAMHTRANGCGCPECAKKKHK